MTPHDPATCKWCNLSDNRNAKLNALIRAQHPESIVPATPGWLCVKCGRSYAPFVSDCMVCNAQVRP